MFRWLESSNEQPKDRRLWREGPGAAVAMLAAQAAKGPVKVAELLVRAAESLHADGIETPEQVRSLIRQFAGAGCGAALLGQCLKGLPKKAREPLAREFRAPEPQGLSASILLVRNWQSQVAGEHRTTLEQVERCLHRLREALGEKTEAAVPKVDEPPAVSRLAAFRKRIDPTMAALVLALVSTCLALWTMLRIEDLARRVAQQESRRDNATRQSGPTAAPLDDASHPPGPSPDRPGATPPVRRDPQPLPSTSPPAQAPDPLAQDREKVRQCVLDLIGRSPENGFLVSDRDRLAADAQKDDVLLQLWAHFYVATRKEGEIVSLRAFSLEKVKSDPIQPLLTSIVGRRDRVAKLLPKVAELPCPRRGP
jgi:hypothetical protein